MEKLKERVWEYSLNKPEGFTLDIRTMLPITAGICVAYEATQNSHGRESLETVIRHALSHECFVGGWLDDESGLYYFDSIKLFSEEDEAEAIAFAKCNKQIAIYKLSTGTQLIINQ